MKRIIFVALFLFILTSFMSLDAQWARTYGGDDDEEAYSIQQTSDGGYILAGNTSSYDTLTEQYWSDILILKLDSDGEIEWQRKYGGESDVDSASSIQQTSDGGYIVAGETFSWVWVQYGEQPEEGWWEPTDPDILILRLNSTGEIIEWQRTYGGDDGDYAYSIQQTSDGGYIVAGETYSFGAEDEDIWVLKLDSNGEIEWQRTYGGRNEDGAYSIQQTSDEGYIIAAYTDSFGAGEENIWILKLDSNGEIEWQRTYGGDDDDNAYSIQQTSDEGYIVVGETYSIDAESSDFWVLKLDSNGGIEWQRTYGGDDDDYAISIQQTNDGGYILAGETYRVEEINEWWEQWQSDVCILKLSSNGDIEWQRKYGDGGYDVEHASSIQQTNDGGYIVAGHIYLYEQIDEWWWDCTDDRIWALKLFSDGDIDPTCEFIGSLDFTFTDTSISLEDSTVTPQDTNATSSPTNVLRQDTYLTSDLVCQTPIYTLTISAATGGTTDPAQGTYTYYSKTDSWTEVQVEAIPDTGYGFSGWTGDVPSGHENDNPVTITMDSDKSITANFIPLYTLTIDAGTGGTTDPAQGTYTYDGGTDVNVTATPYTDYRFSGWTGDAPSGHENDNPVTITMDGNKSITANFILQYVLTIAAGTGGTTDPAPGTYAHDPGAQVSVQAIPNSGYEFSGWTGAATGTTNPITITMDADKSITANFSAIPSDEEPAEKKGGCFIATAAYGSTLNPHVKILRDFRDTYLVPHKLGRVLVDLYYKYSPFVADIISKHKVLKVVVRISLLPFVVFSYSMLHLGPIITAAMSVFLLALPVFFVWFYRKRVSSRPAPH